MTHKYGQVKKVLFHIIGCLSHLLFSAEDFVFVVALSADILERRADCYPIKKGFLFQFEFGFDCLLINYNYHRKIDFYQALQ